jgi:predicted enzyme related to lactoylglutathione lyase
MSACISHVEWHCRDAQAVADFLTALLGWEFVPHGRRYREATPAHGPRIGLLQVDVLPAGETQQAFIAVPDLEMMLAHGLQLGGEVAETPTTIPGYGRYARIRAPDGTVLGLFEVASGLRPI